MEKKETKIPTRERILNAALTLFADNGYDGVGVDQIAADAGVKGPSLYRHFKGKEEVLNALIDRAENYYEEHFGSDLHPGMIPDSVEELMEMTRSRIHFTLGDPMIRKVRKLLTMEQFRNEKIASLATNHNLKGIRDLYIQIFSGMMDKGILPDGDANAMATLFVTPITLLIQMCDREPEREQEAIEKMEEHFQYFEHIIENEKELEGLV